MRASAAGGEETGASGVGWYPRDEARLPRGPRGGGEGEGVVLKGSLPWDGGGTGAEGRGGEPLKGVGGMLLLVLVVIVEVVVAVLSSRRDLVLRLSRLPPTRVRPGSENIMMIFVEVEDGGEAKTRAAIAASPRWLGLGLGPAGGRRRGARGRIGRPVRGGFQSRVFVRCSSRPN